MSQRHIGIASSIESLRTGITKTLKAFANSSPGLRFGNPGNKHPSIDEPTLKELRRGSVIAKPVTTPSELRPINVGALSPGFQSKPWAEISERFQR